jgi:hypothetical protein
MVTAKPLTRQGIHHLHHFRHLNHERSAGNDRAGIDRGVTDGTADKVGAIQSVVSLLQEKGGEGGENPKTGPAAIGYLSPPACGEVVNGGEGGENRRPAPALLVQLDEALQLQQPPPVGQPPVSRAPRRHDQLSRWLSAHPPAPCPPDRCGHCGSAIGERAKESVPVLRSLWPADPIWLHLPCYRDWYDRRLAAADAALADGGVANGHGEVP